MQKVGFKEMNIQNTKLKHSPFWDGQPPPQLGNDLGGGAVCGRCLGAARAGARQWNRLRDIGHPSPPQAKKGNNCPPNFSLVFNCVNIA